MTSHKGHDHPNTPAARAACRRAKATPTFPAPQMDPNDPGRVLEFSPAVGIPTFTRTTELHCELCGTLDYEAIHGNDDTDSCGYTTCCNEPRCYGDSTVVWRFVDESTGIAGTIESCCTARITFPHDMMRITGRA